MKWMKFPLTISNVTYKNLCKKKDKDIVNKERQLITFSSKIFHEKRIDESNDFMVSTAEKTTRFRCFFD